MNKKYVRKELDFENKKKEFLEFMNTDDNMIMVLATSAGNRVMARNVLVANDGFDLYIFTWKHSRKYAQIKANSKVALCRENVQIEGTAEILGEFTDEDVKSFIEIIRKRYPESIQYWEKRPGMTIIRVKPTFIAIGGTIGDEIFIEYLDLISKSAYAEKWAHY